MDWHEDAPPGAPQPSARGSPTRRRLLTLLRSLPAIGMEVAGSGRPSPYPGDPGHVADPIPRLFAEFQALVDRHETALAYSDCIEATLLAQMDYPRVPLPPDWDGSHRYAGDAGTIARVVSSGRHRRRLQRMLQRRQRRWDEAADQAGLTTAQECEAGLDRAALDGADELLATSARTLDAVVLKLVVLLSLQEPGPRAGATSPWRELRLILEDLRGLAAGGGPAP